MASVNKVVLVCTLGKDPEVRQTQNGNAICRQRRKAPSFRAGI